MTIRLATRSDEPAIQGIIRAVYDEYGFSWDPEGYHADIYDLDTHYIRRYAPFWVAELEGKPVGTVAVEFFDTIPGPGPLHHDGTLLRISGTQCALERLYVHPDARRKGIGGALFQRAVDTALLRSARAMEIWSDKKLVDAHRLYQDKGAVLVGERILNDPDLSPEWGLRLNLS